MKTRALRFHGTGELRLETVPLRPHGDAEVSLIVDACAVCDSDLAFVAGTTRPRRAPVTLGHEVAATVAESRATGWAAGDQVVVTAGIPCTDCRRCREDRVNLCERLALLGVDIDGGMADRLVVPGSALVRRPKGVTAEAAATVDAAAAAYHAIARRGRLRPGDAAVVLAVGVMGGFAVQIAKTLGAAPVIAIDADADAAGRVRDLGADEVLVLGAGRSVGRDVKMLTGGGADVAVDFAGEPATVDAAVKSLRPGGVAVTAGLGTEPVTAVPTVLWALHEYELRGSFGSLPGDAARVLTWLEEGTLRPPDVAAVALADAAGAILDRAAQPAQLPDRLVLVP